MRLIKIKESTKFKNYDMFISKRLGELFYILNIKNDSSEFQCNIKSAQRNSLFIDGEVENCCFDHAIELYDKKVEMCFHYRVNISTFAQYIQYIPIENFILRPDEREPNFIKCGL